MRLYQRKVMLVAVRILGDADEAAEAVQAGFVSAYLNIGRLKKTEHFEDWLLRIIANAAINQARITKRRVDKLKISGLGRGKKSVSPPDRESVEELKEAIRRAILKLSKKEAKAISLLGLEDLSYKQVAGIMGCTIAAAKWYVFRARQEVPFSINFPTLLKMAAAIAAAAIVLLTVTLNIEKLTKIKLDNSRTVEVKFVKSNGSASVEIQTASSGSHVTVDIGTKRMLAECDIEILDKNDGIEESTNRAAWIIISEPRRVYAENGANQDMMDIMYLF